MNLEEFLGIKIADTVCISLKDDEEKRKKTIEECAKVGIIPKFYLASKHPNGGVKGCFESHKYCLQYAKENNLDNILILEDDVRFDVPDQTSTIDIPKNFDMIHLGYHACRGHKYNENVLKLQCGLTTHAYIINKHVIDTVLELMETDWKVGVKEFGILNQYERPFFNNGLYAIDMLYAKCIHHHFDNSYGVYPILAYQRPGFSSIEKTTTDYTMLFNTKAEIFFNKSKGDCLGTYYFNDQTKDYILYTLKGNTRDNLADYYILVHDKYMDETIPETVCNFDEYDLNNPLDVLYLSDNDIFYLRNSYFTKELVDVKQNYVYPNVIRKQLPQKFYPKTITTKPMLCLYGDQIIAEKLLKKNPELRLKYLVHIVGNSGGSSDNSGGSSDNSGGSSDNSGGSSDNSGGSSDNSGGSSDNDSGVIYISPQEYPFIPTHTLVLINNITFFIDQPVHFTRCIMYQTQETFDTNWRNQVVPYNGYPLFHNMIKYINTILFATNDIREKFIANYKINDNRKTLLTEYNPKPNNAYYFETTMENMEIFKRIKECIPNVKRVDKPEDAEVVIGKQYDQCISLDINEDINITFLRNPNAKRKYLKDLGGTIDLAEII
jgi:GR25 family glycosyltransferase involved in LPS biosynthesis